MKNLKNYIVLLLILFLGINTISFAQPSCPIGGLANDITDNRLGPAVKDFIDNNDGITSWLFLFDAFQQTRVFTKDVPTLNKIKGLLNDVNFKNKLGDNWADELSVVLEKNRILHCDAAGSATGLSRYFSNMDEFLDEFKYLVDNFDITQGGANQFYRWVKRINLNGSAMTNPNSPIIAEMYQTLYLLKKRGFKGSDISSFGGTFAIGSNKYDLLTQANKYIELKNVNFVDYPLKGNAHVTQQFVEGYLKNISSFDNFEFVVHFKKLKAHGWADKTAALDNMKNQFKEFIKLKPDETFNAIWGNQNLRTSLFGAIPANQLNVLKNSKKTIFNNWVDTLDDRLYKFIKIE